MCCSELVVQKGQRQAMCLEGNLVSDSLKRMVAVRLGLSQLQVLTKSLDSMGG